MSKLSQVSPQLSRKFIDIAMTLFRGAGFRTVYAVQEGVYMLRSEVKEEQEKYGTPCFSARAMEAIGFIARSNIKGTETNNADEGNSKSKVAGRNPSS